MKLNLTFCRRCLFTSAALLIVVALLVAVAVIPSIKAEVLRGGTPEKVINIFWMNVIFTVLIAIGIWFIAIRTQSRRFLPLFFLGFLALMIFLLGFALNDAGQAYRSHGPGMQTASMVLIIGAVIDLIALLLVVIAASFFPKKT